MIPNAARRSAFRRFELHRDVVPGIVAEGVAFSNGYCSLTWLTPHTSVACYPSIETLEAIHGHAGQTRIVYLDEVE